MRWLLARAGTLALYCLVIVGGSNWDRDPDSWLQTGCHIIAPALWLWWAVTRTIRHKREDSES